MSGYEGNGTFADVLAQSPQWGTSSTSLAAILIALSIAGLFSVFRSSSASDDKIPKLKGFHLATAWRFFTRRYDFFGENFKKTKSTIFSFRVLQHRVIALSGEENRKVFFTDRGLNLGQGYVILVGGIPTLQDVKDASRDPAGIVKRLSLLLRQESLKSAAPPLLEDINNRMKEWGTEGKINPFNEVYDILFQTTIRVATCRELSDDRAAVDRLAQHYWNLEKSATPVNVLLPWLPSSANKARQKATIGLYSTFLSYVQLRRKSLTPSSDPIDTFIANGVSDVHIVGIIMQIIFAGVVNTGVNTCWALLHLGTHPEWKRKATDEFKALLNNYTDATSSDPLHIRLSTIPVEAWENELPSVEAIIRETLRISTSFTILRRNMEKDIQIGNATIKPGDFLAYPSGDVNLNPNIYPNPTKFDPDRFGPGREEDKKETFGYLAWGAGLHPCVGVKIAKLEMKLVLAMILLGYEYELVDGKNNRVKSVPPQNRNDLQQARPLGDPCYLKFKRIIK